ncbi:ribonucleotide reductase [Cutibacterium acnes JCM 18918]|nr:ribonucleotide reductase [Cutibacterium acnes JCM 18918]
MGARFIAPMGHVRMMAAVQPFLSGAISKTVNLPESSTVENIAGVYMEGWKLGLKALAVYRDNCKVGQPLSEAKKKGRGREGRAGSSHRVPPASSASTEVAHGPHHQLPGRRSRRLPHYWRLRLRALGRDLPQAW